MNKHDHQAAVGWFEKALPLLERATPEDLAGELGRQGEAFVGMGVSYWETGQHDKAVALTIKGVAWMEQAVKQGTLDRSVAGRPLQQSGVDATEAGGQRSGQAFPGDGRPGQERDAEIAGIFPFREAGRKPAASYTLDVAAAVLPLHPELRATVSGNCIYGRRLQEALPSPTARRQRHESATGVTSYNARSDLGTEYSFWEKSR